MDDYLTDNKLFTNILKGHHLSSESVVLSFMLCGT